MTHTLKTIIPLAFVFAFLVATNFLYAAWTAPTAAAPGDNAPAPINVGSAAQQKYGDLGVFDMYASGAVAAGVQMRSPAYCNVDGTICKTLEELLALAESGGASGGAYTRSYNTLSTAGNNFNYQTGGSVCSYPNPVTGSCTCPSGYTASLLSSTAGTMKYNGGGENYSVSTPATAVYQCTNS